jgi:Ca-activated chloride channel family protein
MTVVYPSMLLLFIGLPILMLLQFREYRINRQDLMRIGGYWEYEDVRTIFFIKWFLSALLMILSYLFLVLSLAGLTWGEEPIEEDRIGLDIMYVVDVSYSMLAEDIAPSRLGRAREVIRGLSENFPGARFGLVAFKGQATVMLPATEDVYALENALNYLGTEVISSPGTNLEQALRSALDAMPTGSNRNRIIILFSDGEGLDGSVTEPVLQAGRQGIPVYTYGLGDEDGTTIPIGEGRVLRDSDGNPVLTRLDSLALQEVSRISRGRYFEAAMGLGSLDSTIRDLVGQRGRDGFRLVSISRYRLFLGLALLTYVGYIIIRKMKFRGLF